MLIQVVKDDQNVGRKKDHVLENYKELEFHLEELSWFCAEKDMVKHYMILTHYGSTELHN